MYRDCTYHQAYIARTQFVIPCIVLYKEKLLMAHVFVLFELHVPFCSIAHQSIQVGRRGLPTPPCSCEEVLKYYSHHIIPHLLRPPPPKWHSVLRTSPTSFLLT